jgi:hypothetical protein
VQALACMPHEAAVLDRGIRSNLRSGRSRVCIKLLIRSVSLIGASQNSSTARLIDADLVAENIYNRLHPRKCARPSPYLLSS